MNEFSISGVAEKAGPEGRAGCCCRWICGKIATRQRTKAEFSWELQEVRHLFPNKRVTSASRISTEGRSEKLSFKHRGKTELL